MIFRADWLHGWESIMVNKVSKKFSNTEPKRFSSINENQFIIISVLKLK